MTTTYVWPEVDHFEGFVRFKRERSTAYMIGVPSEVLVAPDTITELLEHYRESKLVTEVALNTSADRHTIEECSATHLAAIAATARRHRREAP